MDKLDSLRAFVKVVELGSFSEAGRQLRLSRSAVSKAIGELEESLGVQLLHRTTRHASPNENGQLYYDRALGILADLDAADQAVTQMQAAPRGLLRINAPMSFGTLRLGPALADFMTAHPQMQVHLVLSDDQIDPVQGGFDVTLRIADLESSSLIARRIMPIGRSLYAAPDYLAAHGEPQHPRDLREHALLTYGFLLTGHQWKLTGPDGEHWVQPNWTLCANNAEVLRDAAAAGRGVALLPDFIAEPALREGRLRVVMGAYQAPALALHALYPPTRHLAVKVRLLIDFLVARFAGRSEGDGTRLAVTRD
jgi:DNA-binding transcriptional LysR family regulator